MPESGEVVATVDSALSDGAVAAVIDKLTYISNSVDFIACVVYFALFILLAYFIVRLYYKVLTFFI